MFSTKKYLPVFAAFFVGVIAVAGYGVHAANVTPSASVTPQVQTTAQDPNNLDGETADDANATVQTSAQDPKELDGETNDNAKTAASAMPSTHEAESGPADTGSDTGESETGN